MTAIDYYELHISLIEIYNSVFEFWLSITFAFILTIHFSSDKLEKNIYYLLIAIYAIASTLFIFRYTNLLASGLLLLRNTVEAGFELAPYIVDNNYGIFLAYATAGLMVVATILALIFALIKLKRHSGT